MSSKYSVYDTFNQRTISRHRSLEAAVKAEHRFQRAVKRANGESSYIPTEIWSGNEPIWLDIDLRIVEDIKAASGW